MEETSEGFPQHGLVNLKTQHQYTSSTHFRCLSLSLSHTACPKTQTFLTQSLSTKATRNTCLFLVRRPFIAEANRMVHRSSRVLYKQRTAVCVDEDAAASVDIVTAVVAKALL